MEKQNGEGFMFPYKNRRIGKSFLLDIYTVERLDRKNGVRHNDDNLFIFCVQCSVYMEFKHGIKNNLDGMYRCPKCGRRVRELTPYNQLERENKAFYISDSDTDDEWDDYDLAMYCHDDY